MKWSTRTQYILYLSVLHAALIFLVYKVLFQDKVLFIASELFLMLSIGVSIRVYQNFMKPNEFVKSGIEAIKDKDFTIKFVPTGQGEIDTLIEVYNLMIDQLREERTKLNEQHYFLEKLIAASPIAILILDFDDRIESLNRKARTLLKADTDRLLGKPLPQTGIAMLMDLDSLSDGESRIVRSNGVETYKAQRSHFMDQGFRRSFLMIEELTTELLETEKKAYGKVIRMMAHEVNNTLGATDSILQTTLLLLNGEHAELSDALRIASERNHRLTRFMRNFADVVRLPPPRCEAVDFGRLVQDVVVFMQSYTTAKGVYLEIKSMSEEPIVVQADPGQMEQVLINVLKNATEACDPGHRIELRLSKHYLAIRNNGQPLSPQTLPQLFTSFYSSKPNGQGIGLTLSREILMNHGFSFSLKTGEDGWTEFLVEF